MNPGADEPRARGARDAPGTAPGPVPSPRRSDQDGTAARRPAGTPAAGAHARRHRLPSVTALVLVGALCAVGLAFLAARFAGMVRVFSAEAVTALVLALATLAFGFWVLCRIRPVRDPAAGPSLTALAWGLAAATAAGVVANEGLLSVWAKSLGLDFAGSWGPALTAPLNEEVLKLAGVVLVAVAFPHALRGPVDGFVFGSLTGLGFEVTENFIYAMNAVVQAGGTSGVVAVVQSTIVRVFLAGLGSHWAMSAVAGAAVGLLAAAGWRPGRRRAAGAGLLVGLAVALHWLVDAPAPGGMGGLLSKVAVVFLTTMVVYFAFRRTYRRRVRGALASEGGTLGMRRSEATALATRHGRRRELVRVAAPQRPAALRRQEQMLAVAEDRAARYAP
ncbi:MULTISPECIES: PrsW family glutamic-type intramembrane protease [unclassified Nocardiopsis]|uniref:PrsW family glutamic-type intramembrane protease n=1 Tax=unclassified Nocardiopsis TaxID=2649073 RepID=UPI00135B5C83|nr:MULTISPECIES: PrsW family glutamic-type intramembrane protease [unclassified Nocardiopsis]